jgi:hypothetical protein
MLGLLIAALLVLVVLGLAQLLLPSIAVKAIRDKVARYGEVRSVSLHAFPAIELIWGHAGSASVDLSSASLSGEQLVDLLREAGGVQELQVKAAKVSLKDVGLGGGAVTLLDASLRKRNADVDASAVLTQQALSAALPPGFSIRSLSSEDGEVQARVEGGLLGFKIAADAVVHAAEGKLLLSASGPLLSSLPQITLFSDRDFEILSVAAQADGADAWTLSVEARLR